MNYEQMQKNQLRLSIVLAVVFLASVFVVPFLNHTMTETMLAPSLLGIPFVWLLVGVLLHLEFWTIAIVYTVFSNRWESEMSDD